MLLFLLISVIVLSVIVGYFERLRKKKVSSLINVIVLGELNQSPRTTAHALSMVDVGLDVVLVGYLNSVLPQKYERDNLRIVSLKVPFRCNISILNYLIKITMDAIQLINFFISDDVASIVLVQNPPSIPLLPIAILWCYLVNAKLIIDWHNYGYSLLALRHGEYSLTAIICKVIEMVCGELAHANFCVSELMRTDLYDYGIDAVVFYDRPSSIYQPRNFSEDVRWKILMDIIRKCSVSECVGFSSHLSDSSFTHSSRPFVLVSSTSWTVDEDFSMLFDALFEYDKNVDIMGLSDILCIITGKGPYKQYCLDSIITEDLRHISFCFPWLSLSDYAMLLSLCDLGICMHISSSQVDLPMKVVDMLGSGIPVCCYDYGQCIRELVTHEKTGFLFTDAETLLSQVQSLVQSKMKGTSLYNEMRENVLNLKFESSTIEWQRVVAPVIGQFL